MKLADVIRTTNFWVHDIRVKDAGRRTDLFAERFRDRRVLHVGCADVPTFDPENNLHIFLSRAGLAALDGLDISEEGVAVLRRHVPGDYFTSVDQVDRAYDVVLAPEVIEHTPDAHRFLTDLFRIRAHEYFVTAPHFQWFRHTTYNGSIFREYVHPDHKAWYSPYTLCNALLPFIDRERDEVEIFLLDSQKMVAVSVGKPV